MESKLITYLRRGQQPNFCGKLTLPTTPTPLLREFCVIWQADRILTDISGITPFTATTIILMLLGGTPKAIAPVTMTTTQSSASQDLSSACLKYSKLYKLGCCIAKKAVTALLGGDFANDIINLIAISEIAELECEYIVKSQLEDGSWNIPRGWKGYPKEWAISKNWQKANGVILNILYLKGFGQI